MRKRMFHSVLILVGFMTVLMSCEKDTEEEKEVIVKIDAVITWDQPSDIYDGDALSETQLNATADVEGVFVYTPALGEVLALGYDQVLEVEFTPTDIEHYNSVVASVTINVIPAPIVDADGNVYTEVQIGDQFWLVENLRTTHYLNGDPIPNISDNTEWTTQTEGAFGWWENVESTSTTLGAYYNQAAVTDDRLIAPQGWHIPSQEEYQALLDYLGASAGEALKSSDANFWDVVGTNASGFNAYGTALRDVDGVYKYLKLVTFLWTSSPNDASNNFVFLLTNDNAAGFQGDGDTVKGLPVRCIKDSK